MLFLLRSWYRSKHSSCSSVLRAHTMAAGMERTGRQRHGGLRRPGGGVVGAAQAGAALAGAALAGGVPAFVNPYMRRWRQSRGRLQHTTRAAHGGPGAHTGEHLLARSSRCSASKYTRRAALLQLVVEHCLCFLPLSQNVHLDGRARAGPVMARRHGALVHGRRINPQPRSRPPSVALCSVHD